MTTSIRRDDWAERFDKFPQLGRWAWHYGKVMYRCPKCEGVMSLTNHGIDVDGNVDPSVKCPHDCGYDENVTLEEYGEVNK